MNRDVLDEINEYIDAAEPDGTRNDSRAVGLLKAARDEITAMRRLFPGLVGTVHDMPGF